MKNILINYILKIYKRIGVIEESTEKCKKKKDKFLMKLVFL